MHSLVMIETTSKKEKGNNLPAQMKAINSSKSHKLFPTFMPVL